jgi:uncharacterized peroxidase-related enzyme
MFLSDPPETPETAARYADSVADDGYVAHYLQVWSWRPDVYGAFLGIRAATISPDSGITDREVAVLNAAAASARADSYCSLAWGTKLAGRTSDDAAAAVLQQRDAVDLTEREQALAAWARTVATDPGSSTRADVDRLRALGLDDRAIFEVTAFVAWRLAFGTINGALGALPDHALATRAPAPVRDAVTFGRSPAAT